MQTYHLSFIHTAPFPCSQGESDEALELLADGSFISIATAAEEDKKKDKKAAAA